jgi:hypothetical protein
VWRWLGFRFGFLLDFGLRGSSLKNQVSVFVKDQVFCLALNGLVLWFVSRPSCLEVVFLVVLSGVLCVSCLSCLCLAFVLSLFCLVLWLSCLCLVLSCGCLVLSCLCLVLRFSCTLCLALSCPVVKVRFSLELKLKMKVQVQVQVQVKG